jgi:hypothetical protein
LTVLIKYRNTDKSEVWNTIASKVSEAIRGGKCKVEASELSPDNKTLAVSLEVRTWAGLKVRQAGFLYTNENITGRGVLGKRDNNGWKENR